MNMLKQKIKELLNSFKKILFPEYSCYVCNRELEHPENHICERCKKELVEISGNVCLVCGEPLPEPNLYCEHCKVKRPVYDMARSCYVYNDHSGKIVAGLKYNNKKFLVPFMARKMLLKIEDFGVMPDIIVPVPITKKRRIKRGFNQSELLAYELEELSGEAMKVRIDLVVRTTDRTPQAKLSRAQRVVNLTDCFELCSKECLEDKVVLIIDDVFTTGTTVSEVAWTLKKLKPRARKNQPY